RPHWPRKAISWFFPFADLKGAWRSTYRGKYGADVRRCGDRTPYLTPRRGVLACVSGPCGLRGGRRSARLRPTHSVRAEGTDAGARARIWPRFPPVTRFARATSTALRNA